MIIHLLDVGSKQYGDCLFVEDSGKTILIDGSHKGDDRTTAQYQSIPDQIRAITGQAVGTLNLSLLIITHCHSDHIGCLPDLVRDRLIAPDVALIADENVGYGIRTDSDPFEGLSANARGLLASLQEEPLSSNATDAEIEQFIKDAADQRPEYVEMIERLKAGGTRVIRYQGRTAEIDHLETAFADIGLKILGPSGEHLLLCGEAIRIANTDAVKAIDSLLSRDADLASAYRILTEGRAASGVSVTDEVMDFLDGGGTGAAKNNQSIIVSVGLNNDKALLTGDMQFAKAEVPGLSDDVKRLAEEVANAGPYAFIKIPHHASYNAFDERILKLFPDTRAFAISTGTEGAKHPNPKVLRMLRNADPKLEWARTDKNGHITVEISNGEVGFMVARGELNDPQPKAIDPIPAVEKAPPTIPVIPPVRQSTSRSEVKVQPSSDTFVEITARIPVTVPHVTIRIDIGNPSIDQNADGRTLALDDKRRLGGGRPLPSLLFLTDAERLTAKIGEAGFAKSKSLVLGANQRWLEIGNRIDPFAEIRKLGAGVKGVVIVGDLDVVPSLVYDVLPPDVRSKVDADRDPDQFIVWSDQRYGDITGDGLGDLPVSRIPDCGDAEFLLNCLTAQDRHRSINVSKFAVRNLRREFAEAVFANVPGSGTLLVSGPDDHASVSAEFVQSGGLYFMLHGSATDATRYWGEGQSGYVEALNTENIKEAQGAAIFTGCCWGALTVKERASDVSSHWAVSPRTPRESLALAFLKNGALAYVGCTGAHYSPLTGNLNFFGAPMHRQFWHGYAAGQSPALALFEAKRAYIEGMPHDRRGAAELAIEYKILRQFTCLGLGW